MSGDKTWCDECGRMRDKANHWFQIGVTRMGDAVSIELGELTGPKNLADEYGRPIETAFTVLDLCGQQCLYKTLGKLLRLNPAEAE